MHRGERDFEISGRKFVIWKVTVFLSKNVNMREKKKVKNFQA